MTMLLQRPRPIQQQRRPIQQRPLKRRHLGQWDELGVMGSDYSDQGTYFDYSQDPNTGQYYDYTSQYDYTGQYYDPYYQAQAQSQDLYGQYYQTQNQQTQYYQDPNTGQYYQYPQQTQYYQGQQTQQAQSQGQSSSSLASILKMFTSGVSDIAGAAKQVAPIIQPYLQQNPNAITQLMGSSNPSLQLQLLQAQLQYAQQQSPTSTLLTSLSNQINSILQQSPTLANTLSQATLQTVAQTAQKSFLDFVKEYWWIAPVMLTVYYVGKKI